MMRFKKLCFLLAGIGFAFSSFPQNAQPVNLQCEYLKNPIGLDASAPRLMWQMDDNRNGAFQSAYQVQPGWSINEVEMTSQGVGKPLDAFSQIEAERAYLLFGHVRIESHSWDMANPLNPANADQLGHIVNNDRAAYKYINFGDGAASINVRVAPGAKPGKIYFQLDNTWSSPIGTLDIPGGGDGKTWTILTCKINEVKGLHALHFTFAAEEKESYTIDWFKFNKKTK